MKRAQWICEKCVFWRSYFPGTKKPECKLDENNFHTWWDTGRKDLYLDCPFELEHLLDAEGQVEF